MGVYDQLEQLNKPVPTPKALVGSSDAPRVTSIPPEGVIHQGTKAKIPTSVESEPDKEVEVKNLTKILPEPLPSRKRDTAIPRHHGIVTPRNHETTASRYHDAVIEVIRKAVKEFGKEAATHRFTPDEKEAMAGIIYTYKTRGLKTSENEIARIAINFILHDYRENGENSVLSRALKALNE